MVSCILRICSGKKVVLFDSFIAPIDHVLIKNMMAVCKYLTNTCSKYTRSSLKE